MPPTVYCKGGIATLLFTADTDTYSEFVRLTLIKVVFWRDLRLGLEKEMMLYLFYACDAFPFCGATLDN